MATTRTAKAKFVVVSGVDREDAIGCGESERILPLTELDAIRDTPND